MPKYTVTCNYVDKCRSDYLQDGHSREGEHLMLASPTYYARRGASLGAPAVQSIIDQLMDDLSSGPTELDNIEEITEAMMRDAIRDCLDDGDGLLAYDLRPCDGDGSEIAIAPEDDLGLAEEERDKLLKVLEDSDVYCYFYLSWEVADDA